MLSVTEHSLQFCFDLGSLDSMQTRQALNLLTEILLSLPSWCAGIKDVHHHIWLVCDVKIPYKWYYVVFISLVLVSFTWCKCSRFFRLLCIVCSFLLLSSFLFIYPFIIWEVLGLVLRVFDCLKIALNDCLRVFVYCHISRIILRYRMAGPYGTQMFTLRS